MELLWGLCLLFCFVVGWHLGSMSWVVAHVCGIFFVCKCQIVLSGNQTHRICFDCQEWCKVPFALGFGFLFVCLWWVGGGNVLFSGVFLDLGLVFFSLRIRVLLPSLPCQDLLLSILSWQGQPDFVLPEIWQDFFIAELLSKCFYSRWGTLVDLRCPVHKLCLWVPQRTCRSFHVKLQPGLDSNLSRGVLSVEITQNFPTWHYLFDFMETVY